MTTGAGTGTASSRREKEDTRHSVAEYYDMIEKEYASAGHIIFFRRLVITRAANNWRMNHPQKQKGLSFRMVQAAPLLSCYFESPIRRNKGK